MKVKRECRHLKTQFQVTGKQLAHSGILMLCTQTIHHVETLPQLSSPTAQVSGSGCIIKFWQEDSHGRELF